MVSSTANMDVDGQISNVKGAFAGSAWEEGMLGQLQIQGCSLCRTSAVS